MKVEQCKWTDTAGWAPSPNGHLGGPADLVLLFGGRSILERSDLRHGLASHYPGSSLLGCSTAGEISGTQVSDDTLVATAVRFEHTEVRGTTATIEDPADSFAVGCGLAASMQAEDGLAHVFVLSNGLRVNGSELVRGLTDSLPADITVTGGLSGDGERFEETLVVWNDVIGPDQVAAVGFYGDRLQVGYGSLGGWDPFGPKRLITRSEGSVLYELDRQPALELYKRYLGEHAEGLPAAGLVFPLSVTLEGGERPVVRTILAVDDAKGSMTFAGDVPEGATARLMKANFDRLIEGAAGAARTSSDAIGRVVPELAILISCVGRKILLKQRVEEEVEAVRECIGDDAVLAGFYSYGEISPFTRDARCELHNQTMTVTALSER